MIEYEMTYDIFLGSHYYGPDILEVYNTDYSNKERDFDIFGRAIWDEWNWVLDDLSRQCEDYQINMHPLWHRVAYSQFRTGGHLDRVLLFAEETYSLDNLIFAIQSAWDYDAGRLAYVPDGLDDFPFDYGCTEQELEEAVRNAYVEEQETISEWLHDTAAYYGLRQAF